MVRNWRCLDYWAGNTQPACGTNSWFSQILAGHIQKVLRSVKIIAETVKPCAESRTPRENKISYSPCWCTVRGRSSLGSAVHGLFVHVRAKWKYRLYVKQCFTYWSTAFLLESRIWNDSGWSRNLDASPSYTFIILWYLEREANVRARAELCSLNCTCEMHGYRKWHGQSETWRMSNSRRNGRRPNAFGTAIEAAERGIRVREEGKWDRMQNRPNMPLMSDTISVVGFSW